MRSISGTRNRLILILLGLAAVIAGAWIICAWAGVAEKIQGMDAVLPTKGSVVSDVVTASPQELANIGLIVAIVLVIVGIVLLLLQIPSRPSTSRLRLHDASGADLAGMDPSVIGRALRERIEESTGVSGANVIVTGNTAAPQVFATIDMAEDSELSWVISAVREQIADDVRLSLGTAPVRVDVIARLTTRAGSASNRVANVAASETHLS